MSTNLHAIDEALAGLTDMELHALTVASNEVPQIAPGLLAWIEGACDWEVNRRRGFDYTLQPPEAAIDPSEDAASIDAMRAAFVASDLAPAALKFLHALLELLSDGARKH